MNEILVIISWLIIIASFSMMVKDRMYFKKIKLKDQEFEKQERKRSQELIERLLQHTKAPN